jgi:hypothetical protein
MNYEEALKIAEMESEGKQLQEALDFGNAFAFLFSDDEEFGVAYICVDKETGEKEFFNPTDDIEKYKEANVIYQKAS